VDLYRYDESLRERGYKRIAGMDEAGRGPIAGPVVAAAVALHEGAKVPRLRDSKKVPEEEREELFIKVLENAADIGIGISSVDTIERFNILQATKMAMASAVENMMEAPDLLVIDAIKLPSTKISQISMIKGESKSASIAAASIVAKFVRDRLMLHYHGIYPEYGFDRHKGYCTEEHLRNLALYGPSPIHRKSFRRVMSLELPF
jgi:ribonuclease HII